MTHSFIRVMFNWVDKMRHGGLVLVADLLCLAWWPGCVGSLSPSVERVNSSPQGRGV